MDLTRHEKAVWQVAAHPAGLPYIGTASADRSARILTPDGKLVKSIDGVHTKSIRTAAWHPQRPVLALGSFDSTISIFALENESWEFLAQLEGPDNEIKGVAWSPAGNYLATCSRDKTVWIWEIDEEGEDFECVAVLQEHSQDVKHVAWHPSEDLLASTSYDNSIRLWRQDDDEWICVSVIEGADGHTSTVWGADFDPNGLRLASCSADLTVKIWKQTARSGGGAVGETLPSVARWDVASESWELESELPAAHTDTIYAVKWGNDGRIVTGGADGRIVVYKYDGSQWCVQKVIDNAHGVFEINSVSWLARQVLSGGDDGAAKLWDV